MKFRVATIVLFAAAAALAVEITPYTQVHGSGDDSTRWLGEKLDLGLGVPYVFSCDMRHPEGKDRGVAVATVAGVSMYKRVSGNGWAGFTNVFTAATGQSQSRCALWQWHIRGNHEFRNVRIVKALARYRRIGGMDLGYGESVDCNTYRFGTRFSNAHDTCSRPLTGYRAVEPASPAVFKGQSEMSFAHDLTGRKFLSGKVGIFLDYGSTRKATVSVSCDGESWTEVLAVSNTGAHHAEIPTSMLPAAKLFTRVALGDGAGQVKFRQYSFDAQIDGPPAFGFGETDFVDEGSGAVLMSLKPWGYLSDVSSGALLDGAPEGVPCWAQSSGRKVFKGRPAPAARTSALKVSAARNEAEAVQLVFRPNRSLKGVKVQVSGLDEIDVNVRRVGYVLVDLPMDNMGARGLWPDPIFNQDDVGCDLAAGENQPFWITARPKRDAKAGTHKGVARVTSVCGLDFALPIEVRVFDFEFPDKMTCETAFGLSFGRVFEYQHVRRKEDRAAVAAKYLEMFARHHISPYTPMCDIAAGTFTDKWTKNGDPADAKPTFDWGAWDAAVEKALGEYNFNTVKIPLRGMGSSDPVSRRPRSIRKINGICETNALYEIYMERYLKAVEAHIREKGWLDKAYVYSFDEPNPEDYDYVKEDLFRIKKYAPSLRRMVTEHPHEKLYGAVNLWCPMMEQYNREKAWARLAAGDQVWWYIIFMSKQPKVNAHIEHSGVDMRVWLWQTWLEKVTGVLNWETVHWNSKTVYPDPQKRQNPYEDAMVWAKDRPWSSGEGRFVYPPRRCFFTDEPVIEGPVDSIRFEMLREGIEDYEYFAMLKRLDPSNVLLDVPNDVAESLERYSTDPAPIELHRVRLAEAIERKSKEGK